MKLFLIPILFTFVAFGVDDDATKKRPTSPNPNEKTRRAPPAADPKCKTLVVTIADTLTGKPSTEFPKGFQKGKLLGSGGQGEVFLATDRDGATYAIKIASVSEITKDWENRVLLGVDSGVRMQGTKGYVLLPNGKAALILDYVEGESLVDTIRLGGLAVAEESFNFFDNLTLQIARAHKKNRAHRDLNPKNILKVKGNRPVLLDWGIAKALNEPNSSFSGHLAWASESALKAEKTAEDNDTVPLLRMAQYALLRRSSPPEFDAKTYDPEAHYGFYRVEGLTPSNFHSFRLGVSPYTILETMHTRLKPSDLRRIATLSFFYSVGIEKSADVKAIFDYLRRMKTVDNPRPWEIGGFDSTPFERQEAKVQKFIFDRVLSKKTPRQLAEFIATTKEADWRAWEMPPKLREAVLQEMKVLNEEGPPFDPTINWGEANPYLRHPEIKKRIKALVGTLAQK